MFVILLSVIVVTSFLKFWFRLKNKNKEFYNNIPGPPPLPLLGNTLDFKSTSQMLEVLTNYSNNYGGVVKLHAGPVDVVLLVSDYNWFECILSSTRVLHKADDYDFLTPWLGTGLLTSKGPKWKKHRKMLTPSFHFQILEGCVDVFDSNSNILVTKLGKEVGKGSVDIYPLVTLCALDIIHETAMGTKINAQEDKESVYVQSVKKISKVMIERTYSIMQRFNLTYPLTKNYYIEKNALKVLHTHSNDIINKRRKHIKSPTENNKDEINYGIKRKQAFLDLLLQTTVDGRPLSQEEIREEVDTFMFEGHDTTTSALSFTLYCLANHPEVQVKALEEQVALFGNNSDHVPTYADLQKMKYLEQVIKETMRLYSTVPFIGRKSNEPIEFNGVVIPKDVSMFLNIYGVHRNPTYFPEPEKFNPDRFDDRNTRKPYVYIPFSAGPRNCIGQKFAMLEMKAVVSKILRKFELMPATPVHKLNLSVEMILKSTTGIKISLKLRN